MCWFFFLCLFVQTKTDSIFADQDKPLTESCRLAKRIQGSTILSLPWNASNHRNGVISLNRVKEPYTPLRLKSYQEYNEILRILTVLKGIGVVFSLTTQAAALITFGKWGLRKYPASHPLPPACPFSCPPLPGRDPPPRPGSDLTYTEIADEDRLHFIYTEIRRAGRASRGREGYS